MLSENPIYPIYKYIYTQLQGATFVLWIKYISTQQWTRDHFLVYLRISNLHVALASIGFIVEKIVLSTRDVGVPMSRIQCCLSGTLNWKRSFVCMEIGSSVSTLQFSQRLWFTLHLTGDRAIRCVPTPAFDVEFGGLFLGVLFTVIHTFVMIVYLYKIHIYCACYTLRKNTPYPIRWKTQTIIKTITRMWTKRRITKKLTLYNSEHLKVANKQFITHFLH